ncbi:hypothetical protein C2869_02280 [Saccharobesus litoralis]|uniref:Uncharacterized protein n=1 Tax=Saccharobesus litoralis TaxID=2172099 RepID=A0A2S0VMD8_9ALTE|nr:hypothetical protein [Saccharobesus litoralis]AWB65339.1 hypothetical protein C2869_02280 [Saccharobesus litoralis]
MPKLSSYQQATLQQIGISLYTIKPEAQFQILSSANSIQSNVLSRSASIESSKPVIKSAPTLPINLAEPIQEEQVVAMQQTHVESDSIKSTSDILSRYNNADVLIALEVLNINHASEHGVIRLLQQEQAKQFLDALKDQQQPIKSKAALWQILSQLACE